jgi:hypothetical protein
VRLRDGVHNAVDDGVPVVLVEAQGGQQVDAVLGIASRTRVGVGAAEHHLFVGGDKAAAVRSEPRPKESAKGGGEGG